MLQLVIGSFSLSIVHALIPNHWIPMVLVGKTEGWSGKQTLWVTAIAGFAHVLSTISLGILIGTIGLNLSYHYQKFTAFAAPLILIFMGVLYFGMEFSQGSHNHLPGKDKLKGKSKQAIILSMVVAMFFSPCLEVETYYFMAGAIGWQGILVVSIIYMTVSICGMLLMVRLGIKGIERYKWHFLEHHEKKITGTILITLGILTYYIGF